MVRPQPSVEPIYFVNLVTAYAEVKVLLGFKFGDDFSRLGVVNIRRASQPNGVRAKAVTEQFEEVRAWRHIRVLPKVYVHALLAQRRYKSAGIRKSGWTPLHRSGIGAGFPARLEAD